MKMWVWSELGLEKGWGAEGKVWRVKQASMGDGRESQEADGSLGVLG